METIPFPDVKYQKLAESAFDDLSQWVDKYLDAGVDETTMIGMLELFKTSMAFNLLEDVE